MKPMTDERLITEIYITCEETTEGREHQDPYQCLACIRLNFRRLRKNEKRQAFHLTYIAKENERINDLYQRVVDQLHEAEGEIEELRRVVDVAKLGLTRIGMGEPVTPKLFAEYHDALRELDEVAK
jgi:phosphate uptake regulator